MLATSQIGSRYQQYSVNFRWSIILMCGSTWEIDSKVNLGLLVHIEIPDRPSVKFRLKLHVDNKLRNLIRDDSFVTVESDGLVGDKILLIHEGSDQKQEVDSGAAIRVPSGIPCSQLPSFRRERTTTIRKYNDLQEAGGHLSPC